MSPLGIASTLFSLLQTSQNTAQSSTSATGLAGGAESADFAASLKLRAAELRAQSVSMLLGSTVNGADSAGRFDFLTNATFAPSGASASSGLSAAGRNLSLFDPESAYSMMSVINTKDVTYKAQFSELSAMKSAVADMRQAGETLGGVNANMDDETIKNQLAAFAAKYNEWIQRFDGTVGSTGVLAGTQAAEISLYELEQSVENIFNGAKDGFHGLRDLGLTIDPVSNLATFDPSKLQAALASNRQGAVNTVTEFSTNFAKSAELLNSANNFIPNRLDNLDRVIDYIADNKTSLQSEFGLGDPARPSAAISKALAAYNQISGI